MKLYIIIFFLICSNCIYRSYYTTEIDRENTDECKEIIREQKYRGEYKKVYYRIKKECRKDFKRKRKELLWN